MDCKPYPLKNYIHCTTISIHPDLHLPSYLEIQLALIRYNRKYLNTREFCQGELANDKYKHYPSDGKNTHKLGLPTLQCTALPIKLNIDQEKNKVYLAICQAPLEIS